MAWGGAGVKGGRRGEIGMSGNVANLGQLF